MQLVTQRITKARVDRVVLPRAGRPRADAPGDELADRLEVALQQLLAGHQRRHHGLAGDAVAH
ncbi:MAG: hypothetical protein LC777_05530, partial [Actinobacteria bacterium]|nr:hypothetical protein [Actinomycetota bacterium]